MKRLALITWRLPHAPLHRLEDAHEGIQALNDHPEVFTLTTCQRALACTVNEEPRQATQRLSEAIGVPGGERRTGHTALAHLAHVASGLDALVPGEDQAPAQYRDALNRQANTLHDTLLRRLERARALARNARHAGNLTGHATRSMVDLVHRFLPTHGDLAILGTGTIAQQAHDTLAPDRSIHVVSRTRQRAKKIAKDEAHAWTREAFLETLPPVTAILFATDEGVLADAKAPELAPRGTSQEPLALIDLGVPRNVDPRVATRSRFRVVTMEDLAHVARAHPPEDEQVDQATNALAQALEREKHACSMETLDQRIIALRDDLEDALGALAENFGPQEPTDQDAWTRNLHGPLAHVSQRHLEAALRGDPPP